MDYLTNLKQSVYIFVQDCISQEQYLSQIQDLCMKQQITKFRENQWTTFFKNSENAIFGSFPEFLGQKKFFQ